MTRVALCFACLAILVFSTGLSRVQSNYDLDQCIEDCRITFDPDKDPTGYSDCVDDCKRQNRKEE
jgi:hypothetical protein